MRTLGIALAILLALLVQSALGQLAPAPARIVDPFLLVIVYCALTGGELQGMLTGGVAGWVQDVQFGGSVLGLIGLTRMLVGFGVGLAGTRFLLTGPGTRTLVLLVTTFADAAIFHSWAGVFDVRVVELSLTGLLSRATVNAAVGVVLYQLVDHRVRREAGA